MSQKKTSESGWTIPDDWDALTWACYQVAWPDSPKYTVLLRSLFYSLTRGRDWDKFTGNVISAQVVGWDIFSRNTPLVDCTSAPDCPDCPEDTPRPQNGTPEGVDGIGACEMPCFDISNVLKIENGVLYARDSCCEWVEIGSLEGQTVPTPPEVFDDALPEGQEPNACGRAFAVWTAINTVTSAIWDARDDLPWYTIGNVRAASGGVPLFTLGIWEAISQALLVDIAFGESDIEDTETLRNILCYLEERFEASTGELTDTEWDNINTD